MEYDDAVVRFVSFVVKHAEYERNDFTTKSTTDTKNG